MSKFRACKGCDGAIEVASGAGRPRVFCETCRPRGYSCDLCGEPCTKQRVSKCPKCRTKEMREKVQERLDGVECLWCEKPATVEGLLIPETRGGSRADWNQVPACRSCANAKGKMLPSEWAVASERGAKAVHGARLKIHGMQMGYLARTPLDYGIEPLTWWVEMADGSLDEVPIVPGRSVVV